MIAFIRLELDIQQRDFFLAKVGGWLLLPTSTAVVGVIVVYWMSIIIIHWHVFAN